MTCKHGPSHLDGLNYVDAAIEAERLEAVGELQTRCPDCGLYVWSRDWHHTRNPVPVPVIGGVVLW